MKDKLRKTVSEFLQIDHHTIGADFPLGGGRLQGSLARARLDAAIRHRVGVKCREVYTAQTFGELERAILGESEVNLISSEPLPKKDNGKGEFLLPQHMSGLPVPLGCGIDVEMVESFPEVKDYWADSFYAASFSSVEIAYCLLQENPRMHFAARWCAKEALKKCETMYLREELHNLELISSESNPPILRHYNGGHPTTLPFAVSISHTPQIAIAMVIKSAPSG